MAHDNKLTHWGRATHICVTKVGYHWFRQWLVACSAPSHYLNKCWIIVNWTLVNIFQWNFNQNTTFFIDKNAFDNVVWKMSAILSRPQCVNGRIKVNTSYDKTKTIDITQVNQIKENRMYTWFECGASMPTMMCRVLVSRDRSGYELGHWETTLNVTYTHTHRMIPAYLAVVERKTTVNRSVA